MKSTGQENSTIVMQRDDVDAFKRTNLSCSHVAGEKYHKKMVKNFHMMINNLVSVINFQQFFLSKNQKTKVDLSLIEILFFLSSLLLLYRQIRSSVGANTGSKQEQEVRKRDFYLKQYLKMNMPFAFEFSYQIQW